MKAYEKIRQMREERDWSQEQLAAQLNLSPNGYAKIERGETRLTLSRLEQLAEVFGIDIFELIHNIQDNKIIDYKIGNHHINNGRDFTIYGKTEHQDLMQEIDRLKLVIEHQAEIIKSKEELAQQQIRELAMLQKMLDIYEKQQP